jgi:hypothetical protein
VEDHIIRRLRINTWVTCLYKMVAESRRGRPHGGPRNIHPNNIALAEYEIRRQVTTGAAYLQEARVGWLAIYLLDNKPILRRE